MDMPTSTSTTMDMIMTMTMTTSPTTTAAMGSSTASSSMDMDMDMGSSSCQISMLWNWTTIDACFLSKTWHITTKSMFAGTCLGTICLVVCLEFLRRVAREYDAFLVRRARLRYQFLANLDSPEGEMHTAPPSASASTSRCKDAAAATTVRTAAAAAAAATTPAGAAPPPPYRPTLPEQLVRATLHMLQFAVAYFVMLLAMYFNGYIIICIIVGAFLGALVFSWEVIGSGDGVGNDATAVTKCCG